MEYIMVSIVFNVQIIGNARWYKSTVRMKITRKQLCSWQYSWTNVCICRDDHAETVFCLAFDFCRFCVVIRFFHPRHNGQWLRRIFYTRFYPLHLFSYLNSWERASIFPFECSVLNKGTTGTIFIMSLVWRGPWLGIEPGTSRTRSQHYTTKLSKRR